VKHCSRFFQDFLDIIENDILVIDPKFRKKCDKLVYSLREINAKCNTEGESYFSVGSPKPMNEKVDHVRNLPVQFPYPTEEVEKMTSSNHRLPIVSREGHIRYDNTEGQTRHDNTWIAYSGSSGEWPNANFNNLSTQQPNNQIRPVMERSIRPEQEPGEVIQSETDEASTEETPLLSNSRGSREYSRAQFHTLTRSPESLDRIRYTTNQLVISTQPTGPSSSERMTTHVEQNDQLSSQEDSQPHSLNQTTTNSSTTESSSHGSHNPHTFRDLNTISKIPSLLSGWFSYWFGCGRPRDKPNNRTDAENG
jgi:hypothetical protein